MDDSSNFVYYTYDSTLKKLLKILKSTTSDNLKQLEDLWDSIDTCTIQPLNTPSAKNINNHMSPTMSSSSHSPLHLSDSSNDSTNSNSNSSSSNVCLYYLILSQYTIYTILIPMLTYMENFLH